MSTRLRTWARTGEYVDDPDFERRYHARAPHRRGAWLENAGLAALVPIGIVVGTLLAAAVVLRVLTLPLRLAAGSRTRATGNDSRH
jgi:hypothetical protein